MNERNKKALKDSLALMGILAAIFVVSTILALVVVLLTPSSPWLGFVILVAASIVFVGVFNFFISR